MSEQIDHERRRFLGTAAAIVAAAQLGLIRSANSQPGNSQSKQLPPINPGTNTSFGALKQINAGQLSIGYADVGPSDGAPVILLHGWPYDIHSFVDVAPLLARAGYRVIVPYVRGYGTTRFLASDTPRNGQQSVVAVDVIELMDALNIQKATIAGFDRGGAVSQHSCGPLARAMQGPRLRERLSHRQPASRAVAVAAAGRASMVVPILFRHRTRPGRL
jgi:hypothetical protein